MLRFWFTFWVATVCGYHIHFLAHIYHQWLLTYRIKHKMSRIRIAARTTTYIYTHFPDSFFFRCILESDGKVAKSWLFFFIHHFDKKSLHFLPSPQNARFQRLHFRLRTHFEEMADQPQWISLAKTSGAGWEGDLFTTRRLPRFFVIFLFHSFLSKTWRSFLVNNEFIAIVFVKKNLIKIQSPVTIF